MKPLLDNSERKVEYVELIYDLIFVYLVSRNVSLLSTVEDGFLPWSAFLTYLASSLAVLQIWYLSTLYINHYGDGSLREHLMLFFNMYLLYYMAEGIRMDWGPEYFRYNGAWALILLNMALHYCLMERKQEPEPDGRRRYMHTWMLVIEAAVVLASIPIYAWTGYALSPWGLVFAMVFLFFTRDKEKQATVDFPHLAERVMLYIVFTFGEMILGITGYFDDGLSVEAAYYSVMAFAIVVGLFSGYGHYYNHLMDEDSKSSGTGYMLLHIVIILALNNITAAMEFMHKSWIHVIPKTLFMVASVLVYYICLFATQKYAKVRMDGKRRFYRSFIICAVIYCAASAACYRLPMASIGLTAAFIYYQLYILHFGAKKQSGSE